MFVHNFIWHCGLDLRPLTIVVSGELTASHIQRAYRFLASYGYIITFLSYLWFNLITLPSPETSFRMRRVTWTITVGEKKWSSFLKSMTQITYSPYHFQEAFTKIKLCYMRKIAFISLLTLQSSLRMSIITWPEHRNPLKPHSTIFDTELSLHYTTFMGLHWRLTVVYIGAHHVKAIFGRTANKDRTVKVGSNNGRFSQVWGFK